MITFEKPVAGVSETRLSRFAARAARSARLAGRVDVLIASNAVLRDLNRRFRGKDQPTDVLSFPAGAKVQRDAAFAGDIAISREIAAQNARRYGHPVSDELKVLLLHGMLHLAGHDHETDKGEMQALELRLRARLGLRDSLIARSNGRQRKPSARKVRR